MNDLIVIESTSGCGGPELLEPIHLGSNCDSVADPSDSQTRLSGFTDQQLIPLAAPQVATAQQSQLSIVNSALNNRAIVVSILLFAGPIGLPALWFSRCFSMRAKILTTTIYFLVTAVLPLVAIWYFLELSLWPLVNGFNV